MNRTSIQWTDYTTNPFRARHLPVADGLEACPRCGMPIDRIGKLFNFCVRISDGCSRCYASTLTHRWGGPDYAAGMLKCLEPVLVEKELQAILKFKGPSGARVFAHDMTDIFLDFWPDEFRDKFFAVVALRPDLTFQVLTKRAEAMRDYISSRETWIRLTEQIFRTVSKYDLDETLLLKCTFEQNEQNFVRIPISSLYLGVSVEDQKTADERIPWLLKTPAAKRFVSYEPALAAVDFTPFLDRMEFEKDDGHASIYKPSLDLVIVGGESGPNARPFDIQWARDVIAQCKVAGAACFVKQLGSKPMYRSHGDDRPGHLFNGLQPLYNNGERLKDRKGGDMQEWPADLRVRELP